MLERYASERCGDCGRGLTWIEIAFGRHGDPVCGACLMKRRTPGAGESFGDAPDTCAMEGSETDVHGGL